MMKTNQITPPPELRQLWAQQAQRMNPRDPIAWQEHIANQAAQWGANQELEACCTAIDEVPGGWADSRHLRHVRRPKPPSLKEQALEAISRLCASAIHDDLKNDAAIVRRALESLDD